MTMAMPCDALPRNQFADEFPLARQHALPVAKDAVCLDASHQCSCHNVCWQCLQGLAPHLWSLPAKADDVQHHAQEAGAEHVLALNEYGAEVMAGPLQLSCRPTRCMHISMSTTATPNGVIAIGEAETLYKVLITRWQ